jgi:(E)-4-hydroxy-3-methylbut-2-enyl-diphosphate synthase
VDGAKTVTLKGARIAEEFQAIVEDYVQQRFSAGAAPRAAGTKKIPIKAV